MTARPMLLVCAALLAGHTGLAAESAGKQATAASEAKTGIEAGPAVGWVFPVFSDKEGHRLYTLRGSLARVVSANRIEVADFSALVFSGDVAARVDTVLLSPEATFFPKENRAEGANAVRVVHDDVEVIGRGWTYDHAAKKVSLAHDVRVTFKAQLNDILK